MSLAALFVSTTTTVLALSNVAPTNKYTREYEYCDKQVRDLLSIEYFNSINLRPRYQRHIRWKPDAMNAFIDSVMRKRYIMPILMYMLHPEDLTGMYTSDTIYEYEVMDGQHRLYTLNAFKSSKLQKLPYVSKSFIVHWYYEEMGENNFKTPHYIFYEKTEDVENWCKETNKVPEYLSREGKRNFDNTVIKLTTIVSNLTMNQRREEFVSLQNGAPVRGSDLLKNAVGCKLVAALDHYGYEALMDDIFFPHCTKKASKYWVQWVARFYLLFTRFNTQDCPHPPSETFLKGDSKLQKLVKTGHSQLSPSDDEFNAFHDVFLEFIGFLQNLDEAILFNPTQIFAIFYHLCDENNQKDDIVSHMPMFSKMGQRKDLKNLWESSTVELEPRRKYFNECINLLQELITAPALPIDHRPITQTLRKEVWEKCVDEKCEICLSEITFDNFEAGHIVARAMHGPTEIDNLIPICFDCNRSMGVRNAYEYKRDVHPEI